MNSRIFREYDIRGVADRDLPDDVVRAIGLAIGEAAYPGARAVVVGRDCRLSSPRLFAALTDGLRVHADVVDIGVVPTPVAYFAQQHLCPAATVMITGSHNPAEDNGFKIMIGDTTLHGDSITDVGHRTAALVTVDAPMPRQAMTTRDVTVAYCARARDELRLGLRRPKIVVDAGNGSGGPTAVALYRDLGFEVVPLYCELDGRFPHHHPDPTQPENLADLITAVRYFGAEAGIALDGDADRVGAVDATGRILWGDQLMILFGRAILAEVPSARFVGEVKCSQLMYDALPSCEMWKVGHSLIKERMRQTGAELAGEMSGHLFFAHRWLGFDDGIYAGARLLELLSRTERSLAELAADLPVAVNTPEIRIACDDETKHDVVARVTASLRDDPAVHDVVTIDGVRARFADGWGLVRASNTQPALVMRCEACDRASSLRSRRRSSSTSPLPDDKSPTLDVVGTIEACQALLLEWSLVREQRRHPPDSIQRRVLRLGRLDPDEGPQSSNAGSVSQAEARAPAFRNVISDVAGGRTLELVHFVAFPWTIEWKFARTRTLIDSSACPAQSSASARSVVGIRIRRCRRFAKWTCP